MAVTAKVAKLPAVMASASVEASNPLPPHAVEAAVPVVVTPDPRVRPVTVMLPALVDGASGEAPKPEEPCTSQPARTSV